MTYYTYRQVSIMELFDFIKTESKKNKDRLVHILVVYERFLGSRSSYAVNDYLKTLNLMGVLNFIPRFGRNAKIELTGKELIFQPQKSMDRAKHPENFPNGSGKK